MSRDYTVAVAVVRTRPREILLAMITMRKSTHEFPYEYGAPLGGPSGRHCSAIAKSTTESVRLSGNAGEMLKGHGFYFPFKLVSFIVTISCSLSGTDCSKFLF